MFCGWVSLLLLDHGIPIQRSWRIRGVRTEFDRRSDTQPSTAHSDAGRLAGWGPGPGCGPHRVEAQPTDRGIRDLQPVRRAQPDRLLQVQSKLDPVADSLSAGRQFGQAARIRGRVRGADGRRRCTRPSRSIRRPPCHARRAGPLLPERDGGTRLPFRNAGRFHRPDRARRDRRPAGLRRRRSPGPSWQADRVGGLRREARRVAGR